MDRKCLSPMIFPMDNMCQQRRSKSRQKLFCRKQTHTCRSLFKRPLGYRANKTVVGQHKPEDNFKFALQVSSQNPLFTLLIITNLESDRSIVVCFSRSQTTPLAGPESGLFKTIYIYFWVKLEPISRR